MKRFFRNYHYSQGFKAGAAMDATVVLYTSYISRNSDLLKS
jgi:hypothetical protein